MEEGKTWATTTLGALVEGGRKEFQESKWRSASGPAWAPGNLEVPSPIGLCRATGFVECWHMVCRPESPWMWSPPGTWQQCTR